MSFPNLLADCSDCRRCGSRNMGCLVCFRGLSKSLFLCLCVCDFLFVYFLNCSKKIFSSFVLLSFVHLRICILHVRAWFMWNKKAFLIIKISFVSSVYYFRFVFFEEKIGERKMVNGSYSRIVFIKPEHYSQERIHFLNKGRGSKRLKLITRVKSLIRQGSRFYHRQTQVIDSEDESGRFKIAMN